MAREFGGRVDAIHPEKEFPDSGHVIISSGIGRTLHLHYGPKAEFIISDRVLDRSELNIFLEANILVTEVDVKFIYSNSLSAQYPTAYLHSIRAKRIGEDNMEVL